MLCSAHYYDDLGRNVKTYQQHYLGGALSAYNYDVISTSYNFANQDTATSRQHYTKNAGNTLAVLGVTVANTSRYDHVGRKTQTFEKIDAGTNILLSQTDYNPIGEVTAKHLHSATGAAPFLQDISYKYNARGWLKRINDPALAPTTTRLFSEQLNYDSVKYAATPKFNGNITEQMFQVYGSVTYPGLQHVVYAYDPLNRLNSGVSTTTLSETGISYDNLGNITSLKRGTATAYGYTYNGNQLSSVSGVTTSSYGYDVNGNANHDGRTGATVTYNLLNLPQTAADGANINITYTYDAGGQKLRKVSTASGVTTNTDYISGIQYTNGAIAFIQTEEGRAINSGGNYTYEYTLTDHLGNNRVTFDQTTGKVGEEEYYPFGLNVHRQQNAGNKYLYNKKEIQEELGQYDYGARFYDPVVGRWTSVDPAAKKGRRETSYGYGFDDPIRFTDPDGMWPNDGGPGDGGFPYMLQKPYNPFSPLIYLAGASVNASKVRRQYNIESAKITPADKAARADLKARTREATPEPFKSLVEKSRPMAGERAKVTDPNFTGNASKTNADVNYKMEITGHLGTAVLVFGAYQSAQTIANSKDPVNETISEGGGWAGAMYGGGQGAIAWSPAGPWGATAGGFLGSAAGFYLGKTGTNAILNIVPAIKDALKQYKESSKKEGCNICDLPH